MWSIVLDARTYNALMRIASGPALADAPLRRAERIVGLTPASPPIFLVRCEAAEARALLAAAEQDCPAAANDIRLGIDGALATG